MTLKDGENALSAHGAATTIGRDKNIVQIMVICGTEEEAKAIIARIMEDIRLRGKTNIFFGGTVDEAASSGRKT